MEFEEFLGYFLGDGCIICKPKRSIYAIEFSGNADDQIEYFSKMSDFLEEISGCKPYKRIRIKKDKIGKSLSLRVDNKKFVKKLIEEHKFPYQNKTFTAKIPNKYLDWNKSKHIIRGLFEADGSLYFSKSKKSFFPTYPRIEIKSSSKELLKQVKELLLQQEFLLTINSCKTDKTSRIIISGDNMLKKWIKEIGFSDPKSISKLRFYQRFGFYIPRLNHPERTYILRKLENN